MYSDLASQRDRITPLLKQKRGIKVLLATDITGEISATETRLRAAINLFNVRKLLIIRGVKSDEFPHRLQHQPQICKKSLEEELTVCAVFRLAVPLLIPVFRCVLKIVPIGGKCQIYERSKGAVSPDHKIGHPTHHCRATRPSRQPICPVAGLPWNREDGNSQEYR